MKVLFLDFDDVLNHRHTQEKFRHPHVPGTRIMGIEPERVKMINDVLKATGAKLVLTTSWRRYFPLPEIVAYLKQQGLEDGPVDHPANVTPMLNNPTQRPHHPTPPHGPEIAAYLAAHPEVTQYAIVDDDRSIEPAQRPYWVRTYEDVGLEMHHAQQLISLLGPTEQTA